MKFGDVSTAGQMRDVISGIAKSAVMGFGIVPRTGEVVSVDSVQHSAGVKLVGETSTINVSYGKFANPLIGEIVRVEGKTGSYYIANFVTYAELTVDSTSGAVLQVNGKPGPYVDLVASDVGARAAGNVPWTEVSSKPTTFPPSVHDHNTLYPPLARQIISGTGMTGGGDFTANRTLAVTYGTTAGTAAQGNDSRITTAVPNTRQINSGTGMTGGGDLTANRTLAVTYGTTAGTAAQGNDSRLYDARTPTTHGHSEYALGSRLITSGTGMTGGGDLTANRTLAVTYGTTAGTAAQGNDSRLSDARPPTVHGHALTDANITGVLPLAQLPGHNHASTEITGLGTAAIKDTGTASGNVPLLSTGGRLPIARIASGTPDGTKFVADDGTLKAAAGGGGTVNTVNGDAGPDVVLTAYDVSARPAGDVPWGEVSNKPTFGDAAGKNTGTAAGTVAAGDDSRFGGGAPSVAPPQIDVFTTSGTWTKPAGAVRVEVSITGGGGGGNSDYRPAGGGGGGCWAEMIDASTLPGTVSVMVGAGGTGSNTNTIGGSGGNSSFGSDRVGQGGGGGRVVAQYYRSGGAGGDPTGGAGGTSSENHGIKNNSTYGGGNGNSGDSIFGGAGANGKSIYGGDGGRISGSTRVPPTIPGGGGLPERDPGNNSQNGARGEVVVTTYY